MSTAIGDLVATVSANTAPFQSAMSAASKKVLEFGDKVGSITAPLQHMAGVLEETAGQLASLVNPVEWLSKGFNLLMYPLQWCARQFEGIMDAGKAVESFTRLENATVRLGTALKNAGANVGVTMGQIKEMTKGRAGGMEGMATLVESGVKGGNLGAAYQSAKDLAAMMGSDLPSAANMMANALEFPERAARTLREAHIKLSETQQEAIKTLVEVGDQAGAQAIILAAVQEKTEGVADAMRNTLGGKMKEFSGIIDHLSEIFGEALKPTMEAVVAQFRDLGNWVGENKATILEWGNTAASAVSGIIDPLRTFIDLFKQGEIKSAMLYLQLQWEKLKDIISNVITFIRAEFLSLVGAIKDQLATVFKPLLEALDHAIETADQKIHDLLPDMFKKEHHFFGKDEEYVPEKSNIAGSIGVRSAAEVAAAEAAAKAARDQLLHGGPSEATKAAQAAYDESSGAQGLAAQNAVQAGIDLKNQMAKSAAEGMAKAAVTDNAANAVAHAAGIETQRAADAAAIDEWSQLGEKAKKEKHQEKESNGPSALEKGSAEAWTGIQDAIRAQQGGGPAEETAENTAQIVTLLQQGSSNLAMGFGTDLNGGA